MGFSKSLIIVPARLNSSRLQHKLLQKIGCETVIRRTCIKLEPLADIADIIVASDSKVILDEIANLGHVTGYHTQGNHSNGTERCAEVARGSTIYDVVINVQGDESFIDIALVRRLIDMMTKEPNIELATLCGPIEESELSINSVVKAIVNKDDYAIDFLRILKKQNTNQIFHHIGVYGFKRETLLTLASLNSTNNERNRRLEQMRWVDNGYMIKVVKGNNQSLSIDTQDDVHKANSLIEKGEQ